jgi:uncharacterized repeat protein (TIGR03847 family)
MSPIIPNWIIFATVGPVGERTFYLQCEGSDTLYTYKMEKQQVVLLCDQIGNILDDAPRPGHLPDETASFRPTDDINFVVGTIAVAYDVALDGVLLILGDIEFSSENLDFMSSLDESSGWEVLSEAIDMDRAAQLFLSREQAAALAIMGTVLAKAGRPPCPLCGYPLDPRGHACPRTNGHKPPTR